MVSWAPCLKPALSCDIHPSPITRTLKSLGERALSARAPLVSLSSAWNQDSLPRSLLCSLAPLEERCILALFAGLGNSLPSPEGKP